MSLSYQVYSPKQKRENSRINVNINVNVNINTNINIRYDVSINQYQHHYFNSLTLTGRSRFSPPQNSMPESNSPISVNQDFFMANIVPIVTGDLQ